MSQDADRPLLARNTAEIGFAAIVFALGAVLVAGARQLDTGWDDFGPQAGYFPLRIGLVLMAASLLIGVLAWRASRDGSGVAGEDFVGPTALRRMVLFYLPLVGLVAGTLTIGVYAAAFLYLVVATGVVGRVDWRRTLAVATAAPVLLFLLFERLFKAPLPKGPLEALLGLS